MRITITIPCLNLGGTELQTLNLVKVLLEAGHAVTVLCYFEHDPDVVNQFLRTGCHVELMRLQRGILPWKLVGLLIRIFKRLKPDVVHVQYMAPGALPILAARLAGVKKVLATVHQPYTHLHGWLAKLILRIFSALCTRFISVSQNAEVSWFGWGKLFNENLTLNQQPSHFTIYNAVDVEKIIEIQRKTDIIREKKSLGILSDQIVIGAVSRLRHEKGIDILIKAFALVGSLDCRLHLLIVGTGSDEKKLKDLAFELKVDKKITFFGKADWETAMKQMTLMDIVVVPSRFEGFGLTAAEAMAMGKPVVASDVFGLSEVVKNKYSGFLFPSGDIKALESCLNKLCSDEMICKIYGQNGLDRVKNKFTLYQFETKTISLYKQILG